MKHLVLFLYIISLSTGLMAICISAFLYFQNRSKQIVSYTLFLLSLGLMLAPLILRFYNQMHLISISMAFDIFLTIFNITGILLFFIIAPVFYYHLFFIKITRIKKIIIICGFFIAVLIHILSYCFPSILIFKIVSRVLLSGMITYGIILGIINIKKIGDRTLKKAILIFLFVTIVFFPVFIIDFTMDDTFFSLPIYYFVLNALSILFSFFYFNKPDLIKNGELTKYFVDKFSITKRECEIILLIISGMENKDMGDKLFISQKTVENHIYNIYQKTYVKNRIQLFNLLNKSNIN